MNAENDEGTVEEDTMSELERLKNEIERQDRELEKCFEEMRGLDPELTFAVPCEWQDAMEATARNAATPTTAPAWSVRA